jgi:hypothetical protein
MRVEEFALASASGSCAWVRWADRYNIRAVLGGFVRIAGMEIEDAASAA